MSKFKTISTGILLSTLLVSNSVLAYQYKADTEEMERRIKKQMQTIELSNEELSHRNLIIDNKNKLIDNNYSEIHSLQEQVNQLTNKLQSYNVLQFEITAYTSTCNDCNGTTFSGYQVNNTTEYEGMKILASDHTILPLYSIVKVETNTESFIAIVLDKGGAIKSFTLDYLVGSYDEAVKFGRKQATVTILRLGKG